MKTRTFKKGRRQFLKGSLAVGAAGLLGGFPESAAGAAENAPPLEKAPGERINQGKTYPFETPPAPIPKSDIKTSRNADVVILGAGISGLCAAYSAAERGANVVLLEKRTTFTVHGGFNGAVGDRVHKSQKVDIPKDQIMAEIMRFGAYHPNARLIRLWLNESGRVMNNLLDMADKAGIKYVLDTDTKFHWPYKEYPLAIQFMPFMNQTLARMLESNIIDMGVEILYGTPAVQLITDGKNRVTGVITRGKEGYEQINAAKGVIICTGGYGNHPEMIEKYAPRALKVVENAYREASNTGDGIILGMWVGAAKQETACPMLWDGFVRGNDLFVSIARQPFLNVNLSGERYANEDAPFGYTANQDIQQPGSAKWTVWDAKWNMDKDKLHGTVCENMSTPSILWNEKSYDEWKKKGVIIEANTLEDLAGKMKVPKETFLATVKRYNELAAKGVDEDFGKDPEKLTTIVQPPFGAAKTGTGLLVTLDGLRINTDLQVLNTEGHPIAGLYAAGNASGDFFANDYPITCIGVSHGRAITFGWLAGEKVAGV
ncbi:MAG: FAD-dependent oxidoreductase [Pseudomonadota bacterium]